MAEAIFKKMLEEKGLQGIQVSSAGVSVFYPSSASEQAVSVMSERGIDLTQHQSRQVTESLIEQADIILTMTRNHKQVLLRMHPQAENKIFALKEYAYGVGDMDDMDISDPFGLSVDSYRLCSDEIFYALKKILENEER